MCNASILENPQEADEVRKSLLEHKKPADSKCQCDSDNVSTETDGTVIKTAETNKNSDNLTANATGILNLTYDDIEETLW